MKLDVAALRYLTDDDFRVLTGIEMGMKNHDIVPVSLITVISGLKHGGSLKALSNVHKHKLVHKESKRYVGYRLTSLGYDYLALRALIKRGVVTAVGRQLGVGKEADVFLVTPSDELFEECPAYAQEVECWGDEPMAAMKLHRLGRTSFRAVKSKRDYLQHRKAASWIYFSRLAAVKEYAFICALHERGFPVPRPLGHSRHVIVMQLVDGIPLNQVSELANPKSVAAKTVDVIVMLARHGLVHCDLNEFNILIDSEENITVIDFPQMVSIKHPDAKELFDRDMLGVARFFSHRFGLADGDVDIISFEAAVDESLGSSNRIDNMLAASGFGSIEASEKHLSVSHVTGDEERNCVDHMRSIAGIDPLTLALTDIGSSSVAEAADSDHSDPSCDAQNDCHPDGDDDSVLDTESIALGLINNESESILGDFKHSHPEQSPRSNPDRESDPSPANCLRKNYNQVQIAQKVRRQRANYLSRQRLSARNVVKDSEKRKVRVEVEGSTIWN